MGFAQKFEEAEILHIRSVRSEIVSCKHRWDKASSSILSNAVNMYFTWMGLQPTAFKNHSFQVAFLSLLICAEANLEEDTKCILPGLRRNADGMVAIARDFLKTKVTTKKFAQKALSEAITKFNPQNPNIAKFREEISKFARRDINIGKRKTQEHIFARFEEMRKSASRSYAERNSLQLSHGCMNASCNNFIESNGRMFCPCRVVFYVSEPLLPSALSLSALSDCLSLIFQLP